LRLSPGKVTSCDDAWQIPTRGAAMATATFTPPKQWEDWCGWALGIWLVLSPWTLRFEFDAPATRNAVIVGFLVILMEAVTLSAFRTWEEWINIALGAWLAISPWIIGVTSAAAKTNFVIVGALIAVLALYEIWEAGRGKAAPS
jgi:SPW repeat